MSTSTVDAWRWREKGEDCARPSAPFGSLDRSFVSFGFGRLFLLLFFYESPHTEAYLPQLLREIVYISGSEEVLLQQYILLSEEIMGAFRSSTLVTLSAIASLTGTISIDNLLVAAEGEDRIAYCDGCWCIPEAGSECPVDDMPPIDFSDELIANLRAIPFSTMFNMTCDPFTDDTCSPTPALEQGGACVVKLSYDAESEGDYPEGYSYRYVGENQRRLTD